MPLVFAQDGVLLAKADGEKDRRAFESGRTKLESDRADSQGGKPIFVTPPWPFILPGLLGKDGRFLAGHHERTDVKIVRHVGAARSTAPVSWPFRRRCIRDGTLIG